MKFRRVISLSLAALMLSVSLAGCGKNSEATQSKEKAKESENPVVVQEQMPDKELQSALVNLEYSMLCASMASNEYVDTKNQDNKNKAYIGDIDADGRTELMYGNNGSNLQLDIENTREMTTFWGQGGGCVYLDKDGVLWNTYNMSGPADESETLWEICERFHKWTDGEWKEILARSTTENLLNGEVVETSYLLYDGDRAMTQEEFDNFGFVPLENSPFDYTTYKFDVKYKDHLVSEFINTLSGYYNVSSYDITGTNGEEKVIVVHDSVSGWYNEYCSKVDEAYRSFMYEWKLEDSRSAVIVVSADGENVTFKSFGYYGNLSSSDIEIKDYYIKVGNSFVTTHASFKSFDDLSDSNKEQWFEGFKEYLSTFGYSKIIFKMADVSKQKGNELICIAELDGTVNMWIYSFENGIPVQIYENSLSSNACYFVEYDGSLCILSYYHNVDTTMGGDVRYSYSYHVVSFDENGDYKSISEEYLDYYNNDKDATKAAEFFAKLNEYLTSNLVVIYDPFVLTGKQWLSESEIDFGETPAQTVFPEENNSDKTRIGFVEVDSNSWLNFREGAGTNYSKVLVDVAKPDSFIKLAKGTPVTILDEVTTSDSKNPLWYKIQVDFGDNTLVGYSSATYIRTQN